ncbi:sensory rhodopsin transducer [Dyella acidiphila]|uniref:Sensory rhodopsin transducer n=1 Tax=Dyella acidiphila TaxID=2775866 RepID=A0ABR9GBX1_9GAMM|nr:sensory rhodopsin transducer [Dyella acidiphila]MBE1161549.1 sensory rhodopsin transducer [Dyella acidiphila]
MPTVPPEKSQAAWRPTDNAALGHRLWAIAEGYIPSETQHAGSSSLASHETACLLNTNDTDANICISIYFSNREPVGPYRVIVPARRTLHLRFDDLADPEPIPRDTDYASVIVSDVPIVVQHTRLDSRDSALALISTLAYAEHHP